MLFVILILSPILQRPHWHQIVHRFSGFSGLQWFNLVFVKVVVEVCILYVKGGEAKFSGHLYVMLWERWLLIVDLERCHRSDLELESFPLFLAWSLPHLSIVHRD